MRVFTVLGYKLIWGDEIVSDENIYSYIFIYAGELL